MKMIPNRSLLANVLMAGATLALGCSSSSPASHNDASSATGGSGSGGNQTETGGNTGAAGTVASGGVTGQGGGVGGSGSGGAGSGGVVVGSGGGAKTGGNTGTASGGIGTATGGTIGAGGIVTNAGGTGTKTGGTTGAGGGTSTAPGGTTAAGGTTGAGGSTIVIPPGPRVRAIVPFDASWLYHNGDATGADTTAFADTGWRSLSVPHDWAIEGTNPPANPFSASAATTGRGAWVASGIAWYRKHFTLAQTLSTDKIYIEFDGVMGNSTVYVNGTQIGNHPYGYVSFRYDITSAVKFGTTDNVIAVKCDTSIQPASRFYAGAGIYRHVRLIGANPVHVDQWATYVQTPAPTTASATVHVQTAVVNSGTTSQSVTVQGAVSDPSGTQVGTGSAAAQTIAAGASASFTFDVTVANPKLWDLQNPNMYSLLVNVQVGGTTVDDDVVSFGIRSLIFNNGLTLNGKAIKLAGTANHQDYHGLGLAAPQRAVQRRIARLKTTGSNAWRTAHDPPSPDFLDLTDRMGMLVLDEFTDVWGAMKYQDKGDYSSYFNKASTTPTGMPALPSAATSAKWWEVDFTGYIMRDRNHPSVALYSVGNEIHDGIGTRTPILSEMNKIAHALDPSRYITQALLDPGTAGDTAATAQTASLLDVWGTNYNAAVCKQMEGSTATKSSMVTEDGTGATGDWTTANGDTGLTGIFLWTGVSYMGEVDTQTTKIGGGGGLMSELGVISGAGTTWQGLWGGTKAPAGPAAVAGKVTLTPDHSTLVTDNNDCVFFEATITGTAAVTFTITGPGTIIAVDSDSMGMESFRGPPWTRNANGGAAYAIVQATGAGTITVTASATGLTDGTASVTASAGTFVPCATAATCD
jgi:beta-galactosidase